MKYGSLTGRIQNICVKAHLTVPKSADNPSDVRECYIVKYSVEGGCGRYKSTSWGT
jgi:hypothetical protein